jgi:hypothetical protein
MKQPLIKSFYGGVQGGQFFQKAPPLAAGGRKIKRIIKHGAVCANVQTLENKSLERRKV